MRIFLATVLTLTTLLSFTSYAQLPDEVTAAAKERLEGKAGSGMIIGMIDGDNVTYYNFNGTEGDDVITPTTLVEIGSISKVFTALVATRMIERGALKLKSPITDYLPDGTKMNTTKGGPVQVMHLLNHTSGLPRLPVNMQPSDPADPYKDYTTEQVYAFLRQYAPPRAAGEKYDYSNFGFALMGLALEHVSGKDYASLVNEEICTPLDMKATWLEVPTPMRSTMAAPYMENNKVSYWNLGIFNPAGGIKSTPADMVRFVQASMGTFEHPLASAFDLTSAAMTPTDIPFTNIGLGWHVTNSPSANVVWHNGGTGGFRSFVGYSKDENKGVVVFVNNGAIDPTDLGMRVLNPDQGVTRFAKKIEITNEILTPYIGTYELMANFHITITVKNDRIFAQATGQDRFEIYPESETKFNYRVTVASIEFMKKDGKITGLTLNQNHQELFAKKVK